ncbi:hypothetical protein ADUPG1_000187, partial [Aduncisulcus paluster]
MQFQRPIFTDKYVSTESYRVFVGGIDSSVSTSFIKRLFTLCGNTDGVLRPQSSLMDTPYARVVNASKYFKDYAIIVFKAKHAVLRCLRLLTNLELWDGIVLFPRLSSNDQLTLLNYVSNQIRDHEDFTLNPQRSRLEIFDIIESAKTEHEKKIREAKRFQLLYESDERQKDEEERSENPGKDADEEKQGTDTGSNIELTGSELSISADTGDHKASDEAPTLGTTDGTNPDISTVVIPPELGEFSPKELFPLPYDLADMSPLPPSLLFPYPSLTIDDVATLGCVCENVWLERELVMERRREKEKKEREEEEEKDGEIGDGTEKGLKKKDEEGSEGLDAHSSHKPINNPKITSSQHHHHGSKSEGSDDDDGHVIRGHTSYSQPYKHPPQLSLDVAHDVQLEDVCLAPTDLLKILRLKRYSFGRAPILSFSPSLEFVTEDTRAAVRDWVCIEVEREREMDLELKSALASIAENVLKDRRKETEEFAGTDWEGRLESLKEALQRETDGDAQEIDEERYRFAGGMVEQEWAELWWRRRRELQEEMERIAAEHA